MFSKNQKITSYLIVAIFIIVLVWTLSVNKSSEPNTTTQPDQVGGWIKQGDIQKSVEFSEMPGDLPANFPIEQNARILRNEIVYFKSSDELQSVRFYESAKTMAENGAIFEKYLKANGWKLKGKLDEPALKSFIAVKDGVSGILQINISFNSITNKVLVETVLVKKNQPTIDQIGEDSLE